MSFLMSQGVHLAIIVLELIGVLIIMVAALRAFWFYACRALICDDDTAKISFTKALALGLEFLLGAEILKTLSVRSIDELVLLAAIIVLRLVMGLVIHWEIHSDLKHQNDYEERRPADRHAA